MKRRIALLGREVIEQAKEIKWLKKKRVEDAVKLQLSRLIETPTSDMAPPNSNNVSSELPSLPSSLQTRAQSGYALLATSDDHFTCDAMASRSRADTSFLEDSLKLALVHYHYGEQNAIKPETSTANHQETTAAV